jgi:hypothetical protein
VGKKAGDSTTGFHAATLARARDPHQRKKGRSAGFPKLGAIEIKGDNILLGQPFIFTKDNIDQFDF